MPHHKHTDEILGIFNWPFLWSKTSFQTYFYGTLHSSDGVFFCDKIFTPQIFVCYLRVNRILTLSTLSNSNGLFYSLFWIELKRFVGVKVFKNFLNVVLLHKHDHWNTPIFFLPKSFDLHRWHVRTPQYGASYGSFIMLLTCFCLYIYFMLVIVHGTKVISLGEIIQL